MSRPAWKRLCESTVHAWHENKWRMVRIMYSRLDLFNTVVTNIEPSIWWTVCKHNPTMINVCKRLVKLTSGESSLNAHRGRYSNKTSVCTLCGLYELESATHMLVECVALAEHRERLWTQTLQCIPPGMASSMQAMGPGEKTQFILSGLAVKYIYEWQPIYEAIGCFVDTLYKARGGLITKP